MLDWLRWRFGRPPIEAVAETLVREIEARGGSAVVVDLPMGELRFRLGGGQQALGLGNVYLDVLRAPGGLRHAVVERFVGTVLTAPQAQTPADYATARARLLPIVRTASDDGIGLLTTQRHAEPGHPASPMASRPITGELVASVALDIGDAIQRVTVEQLERWGVSLEQALDEAIQNLRALPEHGGWRQAASGLWSGEWHDSYESSRILLPDLIHRLGVPEPVALMPLRHTLLVASARSAPALAAMAAAARRLIEEQSRWLSLVPVVLADDGWQPFEPPPAVARAFEDLLCLDVANTYGSQQALLEARNEREGLDVFVAKVSLVQRQADASLTTYAVWPQGVDTLLPRTRQVALCSPGPDGDTQTLMVPWDVLCEVAGDRLSPTDHRPERFRAQGFPDEAQLVRLRAAAGTTLG